MIGSKLAHYEILALLGEGGMGQVYRARDTKLGREVAIKVLPPAMAHDPDRRMRFDREARAVAALRHPHIVTIHSVEEDQGTVFLTMELVEGQTLSELIPRDGMTLDRFFSVAVPLVDAVASAHQKGITHRDLKPANVMIGTDKQLKVLDFGLAKHFETVSAEQETQAHGATGEGRILGTAAYMSPEQAEGKPIDLRSDIFSLGVLLFEMTTGMRPFKGDTNISTITSILRDDPPSVTQLKQNLPRHLGRIIKRCLAKDPDRRYQTSLDLKNDLIELKEEIASGEIQVPTTSGTSMSAGAATSAGPSTGGFSSPGNSITSVSSAGPSQASLSNADVAAARPRSSKNLALLLGSVVVLAIAVFAAVKLLPQSSAPVASSAAPARPMRMTRLTDTGKSIEAAISPDGKVVAHVKQDKGVASLWITQVSTASTVEILPPSTQDIWDPIFDRAGEFIYFLGQNRDSETPALYRIPSLGGTPRKILDRVAETITFSPDGKQFAFLRRDPASSNSMILVANIDGSAERLLATKEPPEFFAEGPSWSPDGKLIAVPAQSVRTNIESYVVTLPAEGGEERRLSTRSWLEVNEMAWYPDGSGLVVQASEGFSGGQLWEVAYPSGAERRITNDVATYSGVSITADGRVLAVGLDDSNFTLQTIDAAGSEEPQAVTTGKNRQDGGGIAWTPDGRIVYDAIDVGGLGVGIIGANGVGAQKLFQIPTAGPEVSPDGRFLTYIALQNGIHVWKANLDGTNPIQLTKGIGEGDSHWSGDGRWIVYSGGLERHLYKVPAEGGEPTLVTPVKGVNSIIVSPDGTRIAFRAWDATAAKTRTHVISFEDGKPIATLDFEFRNHQWSPDGRSLVYSYEDNGVVNLWSRPIDGGPARRLTHFKEGLINGFAFSRDGKRIAMGRGQVSSDVVLITDFR